MPRVEESLTKDQRAACLETLSADRLRALLGTLEVEASDRRARAALIAALAGAPLADLLREPTSYFDDVDEFCGGLAKLGFEVMEPRVQGAFMRIRATKATRTPAPDLVLRFRGQNSGGTAG